MSLLTEYICKDPTSRKLRPFNPINHISLVGRVFVSGPDHAIPKALKMVLDAALPKTQHYKVRIKGKVELIKDTSSVLSKPRYSSYWKESLRVTLDWGRQLYFNHITYTFGLMPFRKVLTPLPPQIWFI